MLNNEMNKKFQAVKKTLNFILSDEYTEDLYNLFKNALLEDEEFIDKLRDKLGNECNCSCKHEEENLEDVNEPSDQFIMTNSEGEALIDTDELQISSGEDNVESVDNVEEETMQAIIDLFKLNEANDAEKDEENFALIEDEYESKDADGDVDESLMNQEEAIENFKKVFGFSEATEEDLENGELELDKDLLEKLQEAIESGELEDLEGLDLDIDLGELAQQLKLLTQQQNNVKFMERDPAEYDKIIEQTFGAFPTDLGGNDEF